MVDKENYSSFTGILESERGLLNNDEDHYPSTNKLTQRNKSINNINIPLEKHKKTNSKASSKNDNIVLNENKSSHVSSHHSKQNSMPSSSIKSISKKSSIHSKYTNKDIKDMEDSCTNPHNSNNSINNTVKNLIEIDSNFIPTFEHTRNKVKVIDGLSNSFNFKGETKSQTNTNTDNHLESINKNLFETNNDIVNNNEADKCNTSNMNTFKNSITAIPQENKPNFFTKTNTVNSELATFKRNNRSLLQPASRIPKLSITLNSNYANSINNNNVNNENALTPSENQNQSNLHRKINRSNTNFNNTNKMLFKKHKSNDFDDLELELEKQRKQKIKNLWNRFRNLTRGLIKFRKLSRNIKLFGNSEEIFDENNPEVFENKLKILEKQYKEKLENKEENTLMNNDYGLCHKLKVKLTSWFYPFLPDSLFLFYWNVYLMILMLYTVIFMPYFIAFVDNEILLWKILENIVDFSFLLDILITFNVSYYDNGRDNNLITNRCKIAFNYLKGWFFLDLTSSIPFSIILEGNVRITNTVLKFAKLPKIYRLVKVLRMVKMAKFFKNMNLYKKVINYLNINWGMSELFYFLITTIIFSHLFGCLWYLLPRLYDDENNWVIKFNLQDESKFRLYLFSLYYSFTTLFTVGFGDIYSVNDLERILSIFWMLFGVGFYSFTIGTLSSVLADMDSRENKLKFKLSILNDFCKEANLGTVLKEKIKKILVFNSGKHSFSWNEKQNMFNELPVTLKNEVTILFILFFLIKKSYLDCFIYERRLLKRYSVFYIKR